MAWTNDELATIGAAAELEISSIRADGSFRPRIPIWVVRFGNDLYIRSVNGDTAAWFRGTQIHHSGRIWAGGIEKDVSFIGVGDEVNDQVDAAYRAKYRRYAASIITAITSPQARGATLKLIPRLETT